MTREIKFRAWDGEKMTYFGLGYRYSEWHTNEMPTMQYTGLKDKNGKEIYEGDVLQPTNKGGYPNGLLCEVIWDENWLTFKGLKDNKKDGEYVLVKNNISHWEVIGNIYENKELLK